MTQKLKKTQQKANTHNKSSKTQLTPLSGKAEAIYTHLFVWVKQLMEL